MSAPAPLKRANDETAHDSLFAIYVICDVRLMHEGKCAVHWFDAHNCSRKPTTIEVILLVDGVAMKTVQLSLQYDFSWNSTRGEWCNTVPIIIDDKPAP